MNIFLTQFFHNLFTLFKSKSALLAQVIAAFIMPIKGLILLTLFMIIIDTASGLYRSYKLKILISSRKLSQIISKLFLYEGAILVTFIVDKFLVGEFILIFTSIPLFLTKIVGATLIFVEATSIQENIKEVTGFSFWDMFKKLLNRAKYVKDSITDITKDGKKSEE